MSSKVNQFFKNKISSMKGSISDKEKELLENSVPDNMSTKENREKEAKKLKYKKMGFSKMIDSGEIDFKDGKKSSLRKEKGAEIGGEAGFKFMNEKKKSFEHPMKEERLQQTAKARLKK